MKKVKIGRTVVSAATALTLLLGLFCGGVLPTTAETEGNKATATNLVSAGNLEPEYVSVPHEWSWSKAYPADYTYSSIVSMQGYAATGSPTWSGDGATADGSSAGHLCHYKDKNSNGSDATLLNNEQALEAAKNYRFGLLYDLGKFFDLSSVSLYARPNSISGSYYIHNYSVYAGATKGDSLLSNCVARGGGAWDSTNNAVASTVDTTSTSFTANVTDTKSYRYVLIVFDRLGSDPYNTAWGAEAESGALVGAKLVKADAVGAVILTEVEIYGEIKATNVAKEKTLTPAVYDVEHNFSWSNAYPAGYTYASMSVSTVRQMHWNTIGLTDGKWGVTDKTERQKTYEEFYLNDKSFSGSDTEKMAHNEEIAMANRLGLLFDLGGEYNLSQMVIRRSSKTEYIHNYSVYAGNTKSAALLKNCVARGGGAWDGTKALGSNMVDTSAMALPTLVESKAAYRYVLIVFDRMGTDPGNANYTSAYGHTIPASPDALPGSDVDWYTNAGKVGLDEIEIYATEAINMAKENKLVPTLKSVPHTLDVQAAYPDGYAYTQFADYVGLNSSTYKAPNDFGGITGAGWYDGNLNSYAQLYCASDLETACSLNQSNRIAFLYDLGGYCQLSQVAVHVRNGEGGYLHNFSVYAGNKADSSLLSNCVSRGGAAWDGTKALAKGQEDLDATRHEATIADDGAWQYLLIVLDRVGTDVGMSTVLNGTDHSATTQNQYNVGAVWVAGVEIYGEKLLDGVTGVDLTAEQAKAPRCAPRLRRTPSPVCASPAMWRRAPCPGWSRKRPMAI